MWESIKERIDAVWRRLSDSVSLRGRLLQTNAPAPNEDAPLARRNRAGRAYFERWLLIGALIGVVAGLGAIVFFAAIAFCTHLFLELGAGFFPPVPAGEGITAIQPIARPWLLPIITTLGGLLCGLIVYTFAPEAEGHGTDAAIEAFHHHGGKIRPRIPPIKLLASAITIGSGGSAGREGPTAQIAAGFGSLLGDVLHLNDHDRRIAVAAGVGAGIGTIFKAPFGGAILSGEVLYKRDIEVEALFPAFIASVVGYSIYCLWAGFTPVFGHGGQFSFTDPESLIGFLLLGVSCGLVGMLYPRALYGLRDFFHTIHIPNQLKPAIGGLFVGLIGLALPQALGMGYGYVQFAIDGNFLVISAWLMLALVFVKIITTSLTIGSGGSGGVFGPGMVIGGFLGGALWSGLHTVAPWMLGSTSPGAFAVVGMGAFFGGVAKAPLAVILMVAEMTGEYSLIVPAMLATMLAYLITGERSIYEKQVDTRLDSPAHKDDYALPLLQSMTVRQALGPSSATAGPDASVATLSGLLHTYEVRSIPIVENGRVIGLVTSTDIARVKPQDAEVVRARQIMSRRVVLAYPDESLYDAWIRMTRRGLRQLAVVNDRDHRQVVGIVTLKAIGRLLREPIAATAKTPGLSGSEGSVPRAAGISAPAGDTRSDDGQRLGQVDGATRTSPKSGGGHAATLPETELPQEYSLATVEGTDTADQERSGRNGTEEPTPLDAVESPSSAPAQEQQTWQRVAQAQTGQDLLAAITVAEAMLRTPQLISDDEPLPAVLARLDDHGQALMVVNGAVELVGLVTRADLRARSPVEDGRQMVAADVAVRRLVTAHPEETLRAAVRRMSQLGLRQLPVVPKDGRRPVGLLRRSDILSTYTRALGPESAEPQGASGPQVEGQT